MPTRRQFLAGATLSALLALRARAMPMTGAAPAAAVPLADPGLIPAGQPLPALVPMPLERPSPGVVRGVLVAAPQTAGLLPGLPTPLWTYNGSVPGPLITVEEGETLEILFENRLPEPTTVHWHGLPVPPEMDGNPMDPVAPGARRLYRFTLPAGSAGTYWYHPHPHGLTAMQVARGLAGCLIVREATDPLAGVPERHLVISDLKLARDGSVAASDAADLMDGREGQVVLVNGAREPEIRLQGSARWRIWNACSARYLLLQMEGVEVVQIGTDGGRCARPVFLREPLLLAPAQRVELLVHPAASGRTALVALPYERGRMAKPGPGRAVRLAGIVAEAGPRAPLPAVLRTIALPGPVAARQQVVFSETMSMEGGQHRMGFLVNGRTFDMARVDLVTRVGRIEEWEIFNDSDMDHPFHLHGTQFVLTERRQDGDWQAPAVPCLQDTVNLRAGERVRVRVRQDWPGLRMFHCHILEHEEAGMMGMLRVDP